VEWWLIGQFNLSGIPWSGFAYSLVVAYLGVFFSWIWFPLFALFYSALGADKAPAETGAILTYAIVCLVGGFAFAIHRDRKKSLIATKAPSATSPAAQPLSQQVKKRLPMAPFTLPAPSVHPPIPKPAAAKPAAQRNVRRPTRPARIVGNNITFKYHDSSCWWTLGIFGVNLRSFPSTKEAEAEGFSRCRECLP
jgi:hypothetical protein